MYGVVGLIDYPAILQLWMRHHQDFFLIFTPPIVSNKNFSDSETLPEATEYELALEWSQIYPDIWKKKRNTK
jgi:hypothetical protein